MAPFRFRNFFFWPAATTVLMGALVGVTMLTPPDPSALTLPAPKGSKAWLTQMAKTRFIAASRNIASAPSIANSSLNLLEDATQAKPVDAKSIEVSVDCRDRAFEVPATVQEVRVTIDRCPDGQGEPKVLNKTNGYMATVFHIPGHGMSTDYMSLEYGANQIEVAGPHIPREFTVLISRARPEKK